MPTFPQILRTDFGLPDLALTLPRPGDRLHGQPNVEWPDVHFLPPGLSDETSGWQPWTGVMPVSGKRVV